MTIDDAEMKQDEFNSILDALNNYSPKAQKYIEAKNSLLNNAKNFYEGREKIIKGFKDRIFSLKSDDKFEEQQTSKKFNEKKPLITKLRRQELDEIERKEQNINNDLFKKYFTIYQSPSNMYNVLNKVKNIKEKDARVNLIKNGLIQLKDKIKKMSKDEIKIEKPYEIVDIVEEILEFNEQKQEGQGLKILTLNQMLSGLPISLAQLKAGNNSEKLRNEMRQLLYSLYRSKKLTKQIYKSLIDII